MVETKHEPRERTGKPGPQRTCAGCGESTTADALVRVVLDQGEQAEVTAQGHALAVDLGDSRFGRGAHVHATAPCLAKAFKGGFARVFKCKVVGSVDSFGAQLVSAADRRIEGLLVGARRAKHVVSGADIVRETLRNETCELLVVARDAAAATRLPEIEQAIAAGRAIAWSNKQTLGALFGRDEVAVCAVLHAGVAAAIASAFRTSRPFAPGFADGSRSEAWTSTEVR